MSTWRKDRLKKWLEAKQVDFPPKALKPALWKLAQETEKKDPRYKVMIPVIEHVIKTIKMIE